MWATTLPTVSDAYRQFRIILYHWMRFVGLIMGQDIFRADFKIHSQTVLALIVNLALPFLFLLTSYRFDNELGMMADTFVIMGLKVIRLSLICGSDV